MPKVKRSQAGKPKKVLYPGNRMCEIASYKDVITARHNECFMGLDEVTIIPGQYDLIRATCTYVTDKFRYTTVTVSRKRG